MAIPPRPDDYPLVQNAKKRKVDSVFAWCEMCHMYMSIECFRLQKGLPIKLCNYHDVELKKRLRDTWGVTPESFRHLRRPDPLEEARKLAEERTAANAMVNRIVGKRQRSEN